MGAGGEPIEQTPLQDSLTPPHQDLGLTRPVASAADNTEGTLYAEKEAFLSAKTALLCSQQAAAHVLGPDPHTSKHILSSWPPGVHCRSLEKPPVPTLSSPARARTSAYLPPALLTAPKLGTQAPSLLGIPGRGGVQKTLDHHLRLPGGACPPWPTKILGTASSSRRRLGQTRRHKGCVVAMPNLRGSMERGRGWQLCLNPRPCGKIGL